MKNNQNTIQDAKRELRISRISGVSHENSRVLHDFIRKIIELLQILVEIFNTLSGGH